MIISLTRFALNISVLVTKSLC